MSRPRFSTLLVDLDGTLIDVEMRGFLDAFFPLASARFGAPGETRRIAAAMAGAASAMMRASDGSRTVDHVFLEAFAPAVGRTPEQVREVFAAFYREEFQRMSRLVHPVPGARALLDRARAAGCELVLATNPVFFLDPIRARVRWAGFDDVAFALVTGAELMRWTKPHAGYYAQILALLGRRADECLMIGDNPELDMAAGAVGIATWLAEREGEAPQEAPQADRRGTLRELAEWL